MRTALALAALMTCSLPAYGERQDVSTCRERLTSRIETIDRIARQNSTEHLRRERRKLMALRAECPKNPNAWKRAAR